MSKICPNCGNQLSDDAQFCVKCGSKIETQQQMNQEVNNFQQSNPAGGSNSNKMIGIIAAGAVVVVAILALILGGVAKNAKVKPIKNYLKGITSGDGKYIEKSMQEDIVDALDDYGFDCDDIAESYQDSYEDELGSKLKIKKFKVESKKKLSKSKLKDLNNDLEDSYDYDGKKIKKAYKIKGTFTMKGKDDSEDFEYEAIVMKTSKGWKLYDISIKED